MAERKLIVSIIGDERSLSRAFRTSTKNARLFEAQLTRTSRTTRNLFAAAGVTLGAAGLARALRSTVGAAIEFESSFAGVRKTVDATEPQLLKLAAGFRAMSREIPVSVGELNRIGEAAGQLGVRRNAILGFTRTVADLGVTTNLASDQAADALARIANITRLPQDQFDRLGATIADLGNKLAATESEIVDFGLRIAAAGKIIGLTEAETLAIAGAFTSVGVEAEAGGTAVSKVFIALANAVQTGGKSLDSFAATAGTTTQEFRQLFERDASKAFVAFTQGLKRVDDEGGNVFKTLKDLGLSDVRLVRAFLSISQSGDLLSRSLAIGSKAWRENTALTKEAEKRYETTGSKMQVFLNRVNDLQITLGNVLAPALLKIITPLGEWAAKTENQRDLQQKLTKVVGTGTSVAKAFASVVKTIAPILERLNRILGGTENSVKLLIAAMVAAKIVAFGGALTGLGTSALVTTGRVNALRGALLRLGAIGLITIGIEVLLNKDAIDKSVNDFLRKNKLGFLTGTQIELPANISTASLQEMRDRVAAIKGEGDLLVKALDKAIARQIKLEKPKGGRSKGGSERRPGQQFETERQAKAEEEAQARIEAIQRKQREARRRERERLQRERDAVRREELREAQAQQEALRQQELREARAAAAALRRERREVRSQQRQSRQFTALGLTATGEQRVPGVGALRKRLGTLRSQIEGTILDTPKTQAQLARIARVLSGKFGKAGRDVRAAIQQMFADISGALQGGSKQGPLTKTTSLNSKKLLAGIGLSPEEIRELRGRLSNFNSAGIGFAGAPRTAPSGGGFTSGATGFVIENSVTVSIDGHKIAAAITKQQQKQKRRNPKQKRGPNRRR